MCNILKPKHMFQIPTAHLLANIKFQKLQNKGTRVNPISTHVIVDPPDFQPLYSSSPTQILCSPIQISQQTCICTENSWLIISAKKIFAIHIPSANEIYQDFSHSAPQPSYLADDLYEQPNSSLQPNPLRRRAMAINCQKIKESSLRGSHNADKKHPRADVLKKLYRYTFFMHTIHDCDYDTIVCTQM